MASRRPVPQGIRITKVGLWYILITLLVAIAATNTGNNALYMVWAVMLSVLVVSGFVSRQNVRRLAVTLQPPGEVYANRPVKVAFSLSNRGLFWPRWFLLFSVPTFGQPWLLPYLPRRGRGEGHLEMSFPRRGRRELTSVFVASLFPFGLFRKGVRYPVYEEVLVYPELFDAASVGPEQAGDLGNRPTRRPGWGHDLHTLRRFRQGDDPRGIHWKQTARTGKMIFMEREAEEVRRLSVLFDNGVGTGRFEGEAQELRFERLVSEAATAGVDYLERGFEVELVTRDQILPFASGRRQRQRLLSALALIEAAPASRYPLVPSVSGALELRLGIEGAAASAPFGTESREDDPGKTDPEKTDPGKPVPDVSAAGRARKGAGR